MEEAVELLREWAGESFSVGCDAEAKTFREAANRLRGIQTNKLNKERDAEHRKAHPPGHDCLSCKQGHDYK
jgi:hypothetical protein